jgi:hypothetical protein
VQLRARAAGVNQTIVATDKALPIMHALPRLAALALLALLAACGAADKDLSEPLEPIGEFRLGYNIVVADNAQQVPPSRSATADELEAAIKSSVQRRFGRYGGSQLYHIAISVEGYSIAVPGIPLVLNPKSVMVIKATVWDDAAGGKINQEPKQFTVLERLSGETAISSGLTQTREQQIANLADNAARLVENWMRQNPDWFEARPGAASTAIVPPEAIAAR